MADKAGRQQRPWLCITLTLNLKTLRLCNYAMDLCRQTFSAGRCAVKNPMPWRRRLGAGGRLLNEAGHARRVRGRVDGGDPVAGDVFARRPLFQRQDGVARPGVEVDQLPRQRDRAEVEVVGEGEDAGIAPANSRASSTASPVPPIRGWRRK